MNRSPSRFVAVVFSLVVVAVPGAGWTPEEEVPFWKLPPEGLYFSSFRKIQVDLDGTVRAGDLGMQRVKQESTYTEDFSEEIRSGKKEGEITFTREYVRADTESKVVTDRMLIPHQDRRDEVYAALDLRATLKDGKVTLELWDPDPAVGYVSAKGIGEELGHKFEYPHPILPVDRRPRRVGDSWSLGAEAIKKLFPRRPAHAVRGTLKVTFARIEPARLVDFSTVTEMVLEDGQTVYEGSEPVKKPVRCAVLQTRARIALRPKDRLPLSLELEGTYYYSLEHRLIVQASVKGTIHIQGTLRGHDFDFPGTYSDSTTVEFHKKVAAAKKSADRKDTDRKTAGEKGTDEARQER